MSFSHPVEVNVRPAASILGWITLRLNVASLEKSFHSGDFWFQSIVEFWSDKFVNDLVLVRPTPKVNLYPGTSDSSQFYLSLTKRKTVIHFYSVLRKILKRNYYKKCWYFKQKFHETTTKLRIDDKGYVEYHRVMPVKKYKNRSEMKKANKMKNKGKRKINECEKKVK